jgi:Zn-dependent protease with chaperone function
MHRFLIAILTALSLLGAEKKLRDIKPGFNFFKPDQDVQLGREAAGEIEKQYTVVNDERLTGYVNRIGKRLAKSQYAGNWPYTFKVVNDKNVNAFALPGGPMYVHTGLFAVAENEGQLAGVLAHEMSHVTLRHGTHQASKANLIQIPAMIAGALIGNSGMLGTLGQLGINLGAGSLLLAYSRNAERDADLIGARMMADVGYNPIEMARFFEKLEGKGSKDNAFTRFLSDHPSPGNRVKYVEEDIKLYPQRKYDSAESAELRQVQQVVASLPAAPAKGARASAGAVPTGTPEIRPSTRLRTFSSRAFNVSYPENWEVFSDQQSSNVTIAPREALVRDSQGRGAVGFGAIASFYRPSRSKIDLRSDTSDLIRQLAQASPGLRRTAENQRSVDVAGISALLTPLESPSPYPNETEVDVLVTVPRPEGLFYIIFVAPKSQYKNVEGLYQDMLMSIRFAN